MKNLVNTEAHKALQQHMETTLQAKLKERGDQFLPKENYLSEWGYKVSSRNNEIPYKSYVIEVQSPANRPR